MRWLVGVLAAVVVIAAIVFVGGMLLPVEHVAGVRARVPAPAESIYAAIADVRTAAAWRTDVDSVRILSAAGEPLRWEERGGFGVIRFVREEERPPMLIRSRIEGREQGFGGRWTYRIEPAESGAAVTITEEGEVYNPVFRFVSRFVFGHHATMETYLRNLGGRFGAEVETERVAG